MCLVIYCPLLATNHSQILYQLIQKLATVLITMVAVKLDIGLILPVEPFYYQLMHIC